MMALEKRTRVDQIEVHDSGIVQIRTLVEVIEDGVVLSASHHRSTIAPGEDYSAEAARVQAICAAIHTVDVVAAYQSKLAEHQIPAA